MPGKRRRTGQPATRRSLAQREGSVAMAEVMMAWEELSDEERLAWRIQASNRRMEGVTFFKQVNLRRRRRGEELLRQPPILRPHDWEPILKRLIIQNKAGRVYLKLELYRAPTVPTTVWGALPCNRGKEKPDKCPRLGWLPAAEDGICEITRLYFGKHAEYLSARGVNLIGKRIFIRTRRELDEGFPFYEQVAAVVPAPGGETKGPKRPISFEAPSKLLRDSFEAPS